MGVFVEKISWEGITYFVGYSSITDRYFTPAYEDTSVLSKMRENYGNRELIFKDTNPNENTPARVRLTRNDIGTFITGAKKLLSGNSDFSDEDRQIISNVGQFYIEALGLYDQNIPTIEAKLKSFVSRFSFEDGNPYSVAHAAFDDFRHNRDLSNEQTEAVGYFLSALDDYIQSELNNSNPIELLNKLYKEQVEVYLM
jgi:hypothetical protein